MQTIGTDDKLTVAYCIPLWLRDEQIKLALERDVPRLEPHDLRDEPIALVCYGPSLKQTVEQVRPFKNIMSCSGAHKFLLDRGIIPTYHVEVDPRAHKIQLLGPPHPDVTYLVSSTCHPDYFQHLADHNAKIVLWHVFANEQDALRTLPANEWAITGGCSVGLRTLTLARFLGFTEQHVFGMDGSGVADSSHSAEHPNSVTKWSEHEYAGRKWLTTVGMLEAARGTFHELNQMPDVKATFYGDGLVQAMAQDYKPAPVEKGKGIIGFNKPELISATYADLNRQLHRENLGYGVGGGKHADTIIKMVKGLTTAGGTPPSVLDYGCGKGYLQKSLPFPIYEYDPAIPGKDESPRPADLVVCTDVLEHIEPDKLHLVLADLQRCVMQVGYFVIHTGPSGKTLADGRNSHLIQKPAEWWYAKLSTRFNIPDSGMHVRPPLIHVVVSPQVSNPKRKHKLEGCAV